MGAGEIVGGLALVGVAVLIGLAIASDDTPESISGTDASLVDPATPTGTAPTPTVAATPLVATASTVGNEATASAGTAAPNPSTVASSTVTSTTAPATTVTPTTLSSQQRAEILVKVLNGGAPTGAATAMTATVRLEGFRADGPADAPAPVGATTVLYAPGQGTAAAAVNGIVGAAAPNVLEGSIADRNWANYGAAVDVLVVLGQSTG